VSQVTKKTQYIMLWFGFFCAISAPAATEFKSVEDYLVVFSSVHLYEKIPSGEKMLDFLLSKTWELPKIEGTVLATLKHGDRVQEFSKKDGKYTEIACEKKSNGAQYDWLLMRDWLCVKVISSDASNVGKIGWLHRSGATSMNPPEGTKLTLYVVDLPPFTKCESGKPEGVGVEIVKQTCGTACEIICQDNWRDTIDILSQQKNSGVFFISLIGDRRTAYSAIPVLETSYALFTLEGNKEIYINESALKDALKNGRMEAYGPSGTYDYFELFARRLDPSREYTPRYRTTEDIVNALKTGKIDIIYSNSDVMKYYNEQSKLKTQTIRVDLQGVPYYIGISKETPEETIAWFKGVFRSNRATIDKLLQQAGITPLSQ